MKSARLWLLVLLLAASACKKESPVERALVYSGANRPELEKVLAHFRTETPDSLKLRAAEFLIANMPGHYSVDFPQSDAYRRNVDSMYAGKPYYLRKVLYDLPATLGARTYAVDDAKTLKADFLIRHIDFWVDLWREMPWLRRISFERFEKYLLPYRTADELVDTTAQPYAYTRQALDMLRRLAEDYEWMRYNLFNHTEFCEVYVMPEDAAFIADTIRLPEPYPAKVRFDCTQEALYYQYLFRSHAVPSAFEFVPAWGHINFRHYWSTVADGVFTHNGKGFFTNTPTPKAYRFTYERQPTVRDGGNYVPALFRNPFVRDVTPYYVECAEATVKVDRSILAGRPKRAYLAVWNYRDLHEVMQAPVERGKAHFDRFGKIILYYPVCYEGGVRKGIGYPFYADADGNIRTFRPDPGRPEPHRIYRKYRSEARKIFWATDMLGSRLEASDDPSFRRRDTLFVLTGQNPGLGTWRVPVEEGKSYRYWRYTAAKDSMHVGELAFLTEEGPVRPAAYGATDSDTAGLERVFDGDILTYWLTRGTITVDLGKSMPVSEVRITPRTDDNGIVPGEMYELFYYDLPGWVSLGRKVATDTWLEYGNMPAGAVFWVTNHTRGTEERPFTFDDEGKQWFW